MSSFLRWWHQRSKKAQIGLAIGAVFLFLIILGALLPSPDDGEKKKEAISPPPPAQQQQPRPPPAEPPPPPPPPPAADRDTGRMSDGEFQQFRDAQADVLSESQQFNDGVQKCAVIGQSGDLAEFSRCMDDAWSGFTSKAQYAYYVTGQLIPNTAKKCRANLRSYRAVLSDYDATLDVAHKTASNLQFEEMTAAFKRYGPATRRYTKFTLNALAACEPK
jgi:hypothetical protein